MVGREELLRYIQAEKEFRWCQNYMELHKVVLYADKF